MAHWVGFSVAALTALMKAVAAITSANWANMLPVRPGTPAAGKNTAISTSVMPTTGPNSSFIAWIAESWPDMHKVPVEAQLSDETGFPHKGTIEYVAPQIDPQTGTLYVRGIMSNPTRTLLPGMFVNIRLPMGKVQKSALLVPEIALQEDQGGRYLFVVDADDVVQKRASHMCPRRRPARGRRPADARAPGSG